MLLQVCAMLASAHELLFGIAKVSISKAEK